MKKAKVLIQVIKVYRVEVEVPDDADVFAAEGAAYDMSSIDIQENGELQDVETDYALFREWINNEE